LIVSKPFIFSLLSPEKSDESERGRGVIRVMNEGIQKHLIKKTTFLKVKRNVEKISFIKGTVCFRYV